ncbi:MAG: hypothetical protein ISP94_04285 [SAR86 cluster bacterium]|nr:hypothetical protein [SAR86 cluster bacterium]
MSSKRIFGVYFKDHSIDLIKLEKNINQFLKKNDLFINQKYTSLNFIGYEFSLKETENFENYKNGFLSLDGIITNADDLKEKFNIPFTSQQNIINYLADNVENFERYLLGNYSIAIYNQPNDTVKIFRDHFGTKPLFYHNSKSFFTFGSEIKLIKCINEFVASPNKKRISQYLCQYKESEKDTFYEDVFSLPPSHYCLKTRGNINSKKYNHFKDYSFEGSSLDEAINELKSRLEKSTSNYLKLLKGKHAVLLSGGLDSSCIYKIIEKKIRSTPSSLSENFYDQNGRPLSCDESEFQELIHKRSKNHKKIEFKNQSPFDYVDKWLEKYDEPFNLANAYIYEEVYKTSKDMDIKILFDGVDGDQVVSHGWERLYELFKINTFFTFIYEFFYFIRKHDYSDHTKTSLTKIFLYPLLRKNIFLKNLFWFKDRFRPKKNRNKIVKKDKIMKYGFEENYDFFRNYRPHSEKLKNPLISVAFSNLNILYFNYGVNQASPFFDKKVVDLCITLPSEFKLCNGESRYVLRKAFEDIIPEKIIKRFKKANLTENFSKKITLEDHKKIKKEINNMHPILDEFIDMEILREEFKKFQTKVLDDRVNMNIWNFYLVNKWLNKTFKQ